VTQLEIENARDREWLPIAIACAIFAALSVWGAITSEGFLEADSCTHYLYARFAFDNPIFFANVWGRPICTGLYAVPALLGGRLGVRMMSLCVAMLCGFVAYRVAKNQNYKYPALALIFTLAQPLVYLHSFSELTELPFALLLGAAFWMYQTRRWLLMSILIGLLPLSRPEGFGFLLLGGLALVLHRRWWWMFVLPIPLILWNHVGWELSGREGDWSRWLISSWPYSQESVYQSGSIFHFLILMPVVTSPLLLPFVVTGVAMNVRRVLMGRSEHLSRDTAVSAVPSTSHGRDARVTDENSLLAHRILDLLIAIIPLLILAAHSILYATGKLASSGELRYMLVVAPFWALLCARGWEWIAENLHWKRPILLAGIAAIAPIFANFAWGVVPLKLNRDWIEARAIAKWYEHSDLRVSHPRISAAHQAIYYFLDLSPLNKDHAVDFRRDTLLPPSPATIAIWDPIYGMYNSDERRIISLNELLEAGWSDITDQVPSISADWHVLKSPESPIRLANNPEEAAGGPAPHDFPSRR
jgi:hypothetical protein